MAISLITLEDLSAAVSQIINRMEALMSATQQDIDNLTTQVQQISTDLTDATAKIRAEIDSLRTAGVDVTALEAALAPIDQRVVDLGNLQPAPPVPPAEG